MTAEVTHNLSYISYDVLRQPFERQRSGAFDCKSRVHISSPSGTLLWIELSAKCIHVVMIPVQEPGQLRRAAAAALLLLHHRAAPGGHGGERGGEPDSAQQIGRAHV